MSKFFIQGRGFDPDPIEHGLYLVATPIGHLDDITIRALKILSSVDLIACEDTRTSGKLLNHYGIKAAKIAYHEHNAEMAGAKILEKLAHGQSVALISDAGTPLISDPGYRLVRQSIELGHPIIPVPGASAIMTALTASGMATDQFTFVGFLPNKPAARKSILSRFLTQTTTLILYESPHRVKTLLQDIAQIYGPDTGLCIGRELTKKFEEFLRGTADDLMLHFQNNPPRGEMVILIALKGKEQTMDVDQTLLELLSENSTSRAVAQAALITGLPKRQLYQRALALSDQTREEES